MKFRVLLGVFFFILVGLLPAQAGQTLNVREIHGFFYADGKMEKSDAQYEITYYVEGDKITRTRVYDFKNKQIIPDNIVYHIQRQLSSDPYHPVHQADKALGGKDVIRAIGQPGLDAIEILVITENSVMAYKSTSDYLVISRFEILSIA